jgi:hypothetical protein
MTVVIISAYGRFHNNNNTSSCLLFAFTDGSQPDSDIVSNIIWLMKKLAITTKN